MAILNAREKLVSFRVSQEEYDLLQRSCVTAEARSISDFTRAAALQRARLVAVPQGLLNRDLSSLAADLSELDSALLKLSNHIRRTISTRNGDARNGDGIPHNGDAAAAGAA